ncbi:hypothetical protein JJC03_10010 [Flavobacterium oreochromis]|uniref:hypothetical protein n=1 Tax=Flavobacterium oreochromis TaxID=2906078 RepID=UPI000CDA9A2B|nr:hypothetical protein [Flavobacterium oreochromis]POR19879.1 hypothetical protein BWK58_14205 [Flavobacterium columnare]QYS85546.1 hypothetical protein JJC03_10010 [Flavobacterium oreochromis]
MILKDAMNTYNPALELILKKGFQINIIDYEESFDWKASNDKVELIASDPLRLLALIHIHEMKGEEWNEYDENYYDKILKDFYGE